MHSMEIGKETIWYYDEKAKRRMVRAIERRYEE